MRELHNSCGDPVVRVDEDGMVWVSLGTKVGLGSVTEVQGPQNIWTDVEVEDAVGNLYRVMYVTKDQIMEFFEQI